MTMFVGGPYDGQDVPIEPPFAKTIRMPREDELDAFLTDVGSDPGVTGKQDWPFLYELDEQASQPRYHFVEES